MKRILFVDDNQQVLDGLRGMLRRQRRKWQMDFATGGRAALAKLAEVEFDVVITDMQMPDVDGIAVLERVQESQPRAVRIVLSGYASPNETLRALEIAHEFLTKPCSAKDLRFVIERSLGLVEIIHSPQLLAAVAGVGQLPSPPHIYQELSAYVGRDDFNMKEISDIVRRDPAISAKLLQIANSALFGLRRRVSTVRGATELMGAQLIRDLVLGLCAWNAMRVPRRVRGFSVDAEQQHATYVAQLARTFMPDEKRSSQAFLGGMLHDIGKLVIASRCPRQYEAALQDVRSHQTPLLDSERKHLGFTHPQVGTYLLHLWGVPAGIQTVVARHHDEGGPADESLDSVVAVRVANILAAADKQTLLDSDLALLHERAVADRLAAYEHPEPVRAWLDEEGIVRAA